MRSTPSPIPKPARVVVRSPNWLGDAVMALPALRLLRRTFADAHLALAGPKPLLDLFQDQDMCDDFIALERVRGPESLWQGSRRLATSRFDLAVLLQNAFSAALTMRLAGVRRIAGYSTDGRRLLLSNPLRPDRNHRLGHQVLYYLDLARQVASLIDGVQQTEPEVSEPRLKLSEADRNLGWRLLDRSVNTGAGSRLSEPRILVVAPGATNSRAKRWLPERFAETADRLVASEGFLPVMVGTSADVQAVAETLYRMKSTAVNLVGETTVGELKAVLSIASLAVSNDTGTAHLAAALGIPTVVVFGPTEHFATRPFSESASVVRRDVDCSPCMLRDCPIDHRCMTRVEVEDVYSSATVLLRRTSEARSSSGH